jgi:hypothetical protein
LQRLVSTVLDFRLSRSSNLLFRKPGFRPLLGPISPGWTPGLGSFLANSLSNLQHPRIVTEPSWLASSLHPPCLTIFPAGDYKQAPATTRRHQTLPVG